MGLTGEDGRPDEDGSPSTESIRSEGLSERSDESSRREQRRDQGLTVGRKDLLAGVVEGVSEALLEVLLDEETGQDSWGRVERKRKGAGQRGKKREAEGVRARAPPFRSSESSPEWKRQRGGRTDIVTEEETTERDEGT